MAELLEIAQNACQVARAAGAEFAAACATQSESRSIELERGHVKRALRRERVWLDVVCYIGGALGSASATDLGAQSVRQVAEEAVALAKTAEPDPDFVSLPAPESFPAVERLYDENIRGLGAEQLMGYLRQASEEAREVAPEAVVSGGCAVGFGQTALANTCGVAAVAQTTRIGVNVMVTVRRGDEAGVFYDWRAARVLEDFKPEGLGRTAAEHAQRFLGARDMPTGELPVVFGPLASGSLISGLLGAANAESVQRGRSFLAEMKGKRVASEELTIVDEPLVAGGLASAPFDAEGVPHRTVTVVERGVLQTYLHRSYTANKAGEENTGHAAGLAAGIASTNANPRLGKHTAEEIVRSVDEGLYLLAGGIRPNLATGDFSSAVDFGYKIERGELAYPVRNTMLGGSFLEVTKAIEAISSDYRADPGLVRPTILVGKMLVAGR